jgi:hypothetical protein
VSIVHSANRQPDVETKRYTMAELYELRRKILALVPARTCS